MPDPALFERNMLAIASFHPESTASRIRAARPDPRVGFESARDGSQVPYLDLAGRRAHMHSRFDPVREATRLARAYDGGGFYVFLGLGAGFLPLALLDSGLLNRGLIVEYRASTLRALLERLDLTRLLADRRLCLMVDPADDELAAAVAELYVPAVAGGFSVVPLSSRVDAESERFHSASVALKGALSSVSDDYSVQAHFGKRWFSNIVRNIRQACLATPPVAPVRRAIVTGAGPSLEDAVPLLKSRSRDEFLIATDTSLPALLGSGVKPDAVISIDCQHISYYHYMDGLPEDVPLFLDLASPPNLARLARRPYFFASAHPFAGYISSRLRAFPSLDTSGGNVTHAALSLAARLGARQVSVYGADYSYPGGRSYARGTYIHRYFDARQARLGPFESMHVELMFRSCTVRKENDPDGLFRYRNRQLDVYLERFERYGSSLAMSVTRRRGGGAASTLDGDKATQVPPGPPGAVFASGRLFMGTDDFMKSYLKALTGLPRLRGPETPAKAGSYMAELEPDALEALVTILPSVAAFRKEAETRGSGRASVLRDALEWSIAKVRGELRD